MTRDGIYRVAAIDYAEQLFQLLRQHRKAPAKLPASQVENFPKPLRQALVKRAAAVGTDVNAKSL